MTDFSARVDQTACDKLLRSVSYPFVVFERREPFPGCDNVNYLERGTYYKYGVKEIDKMFADCVKTVRNNPNRKQITVEDQLYSFGGSIIQQAKVALDAHSDEGFQGPSRDELEMIVNGGIEKLGPNLRKVLSDWGLYAWCPLLRVTLKSRPSISLRSPRIDLNGIRIEVRATGELFAKFPWYNCYRWCTRWEKVIKCERVGSISVSPDIAAEAHANFFASGQKISATAAFDRLRLDYPILDKIPLEGLANRALRDKVFNVYDASKLMATIPVLESRFRVKSIALPAQTRGIEVRVDIEQI